MNFDGPQVCSMILQNWLCLGQPLSLFMAVLFRCINIDNNVQVEVAEKL